MVDMPKNETKPNHTKFGINLSFAHSEMVSSTAI